MDEEARPGANRGFVIAALVVVAAVVVAAVLGVASFLRWTGDPAGVGHEFWLVLRGQKSAELLVTEIIIDRMAYETHLSPAEAEALKRELGPISKDLPYLSEGEKHKLAMLVRKAVEDGKLTDDEVAAIRSYSHTAARDGDAKP